MATFLELCQKLARESGAIGQPPASVLNQTGRLLKCVEWVRQAWEQIQTEHDCGWTFMRNEFTSPLTAGVNEYAPAALNLSSFAHWIEDTPEFRAMTIYPNGDQSQEHELRQISYEAWRTMYNRGTHDPQAPVYWAIKPGSLSLLLGPKPDSTPYIVRGEYQREAQILATDGDVPLMPTKYHYAIVWRAAILLAEHDEAPVPRQTAVLNYDPIYRNMVRDLLPVISTGGNALA